MTKQIAVKVPQELVESVDELVAGGHFDSRSHAVRAGLEAAVAARRHQQLDRRYRDVFARSPETAGEVAEAKRLAVDAIEDEPWERWW